MHGHFLFFLFELGSDEGPGVQGLARIWGSPTAANAGWCRPSPPKRQERVQGSDRVWHHRIRHDIRLRGATSDTESASHAPPIDSWNDSTYLSGVGSSEKVVSEKVGTVGELYEGKIMKKWGGTSLLIASYTGW